MPSDYYQEHAAQFFQDTQAVDMGPLYQRVLPLLRPGGHIVDAGCGSGRDARYFAEQGFVVSAFDACAELVALAREYTGLNVRHCRFMDFHAVSPVDAVWACASLLHVPLTDLPDTFSHLAAQLAENGLIYCSFKYGEGEVLRGNRRFTDLTETGLADVLRETSVSIRECWKTSDLRPGREQEQWLNAILVNKD
ncbi:class I SAM-dependent methyltransferase [Bowmanella denitrificans]|uniref:Class I SAM-dependent methyltransferase n=1 Tax=Bowmanella denitrificans TaxID=366582 RepID=A0ABP3HLN6_9ALTE